MKEKMSSIKVKIINHSENPLPQYITEGAAGLDIYAAEDALVQNGSVSLVSTGLYMEIPFGYEAQIRCRSGLALKHGLMMVNGIGTIDSDYRGEIKIIFTNCTDVPYQIKKGDRIAQMVFCKYMKAEFIETSELESTKRSEGGFGSSGR
jgi:dUTP pyrophosphatase